MKNFTPIKRLLILLTLLMSPCVYFSQTVISNENFNTGFGIWVSGGTNVTLNSTNMYEGAQCVRMRSNSASTLTATGVNTAGYNKVDVKFFVKTNATTNETLTLQYRQNASATWTDVRVFTASATASTIRDINIALDSGHHAFYATLFSTAYTFGTLSQFRFVANLAGSIRFFYVDNVSIIGTTYNTISKGPGGVTANLETWLRADKVNGASVATDNSAVNTWEDIGKGNDANTIDAASTTITNKPLYKNNATNNINFNPVVSFNNNPDESNVDYTGLTNKAELNGTGGFFTNEQYIVVVNDNPVAVSSATTSIDVFCAQGALTTPYDRDGTGFGFGKFSVRFEDESIAYCHGSTPTAQNTATDAKGYGVCSTASYSSIFGIVNSRNNTNTPAPNGQDLFLNATQIDNQEVGVPQFTNYSNRRYWLGRSQVFNGSFGGRIAEVITYSARKNDNTERRKIESYLAIKYGITLGAMGVSMNYQDSNGNTIWNSTTNAGFCHNITGIGRDDNSMLEQKQSKSSHTPNDITIGLGNILEKNSDNPNTFSSDRNYLVWGNNNATLNAQPSVIVNMSSGISGLTSNVEFISVGRIWKVVETGGNVPKVKISIPALMLTATITPPGNYLMFISSSSVFNPTSEYRVMKPNGSNLETEFDFDGTKFITFGYAPEKTFERSIDFDGVDDYLDAGNVLDLDGSFTVSAWIKRSAANKTILSKRNSAFSTGYDLSITTSGFLEMSWVNTSRQTITSTVAIPAEIWHNVAVTFDGTNARLYIDGVLNVTKPLLPVVTNSQSFLIAAADGVATTSFFDGTIDEVRVWGIALSQNQLRYVMNQELLKHTDNSVNGSVIPQAITLNNVKTIPWSNLKAYYPMSTYTFTNAKDKSSNNYTAALRNLTTVDHQTAPLPYISNSNGNWDTATTWKNSNVQDLPNALSIVDGVTRVNWNIIHTNHDIESTLNRIVLGLEVQSNKITANNDSKIEVSHYLKLNGKIDLEGKSQLVQTNGSELEPTSSGSIERDQQGTKNVFNYNYWSSPVGGINATSNNSSYTLSTVFKDATDPANLKNIVWTQSLNGSATSSPITLSERWIYKFQNMNNEYANWSFMGSNGMLLPGEGFTLKGSGATSTQNYSFVGKPNNGTITIPIGPLFLNLSGNPYPSALDSQKFISDNLSSIDGTIYFWEHYSTNNTHVLADYQGGYATLVLTGGTPPVSPPEVSGQGSSTRIPNRFIPVGQGFFVTGNTSGGNIEFNNGQRGFFRETSTFSNTMFRNANTTTSTLENIDTPNQDDYLVENNYTKIRLGFNFSNNYHRQILIGFMDNFATSAIDPGYDAVLFDDYPSDFYFINGESKLVIQGESYFNINASYLLGVKTVGGNVQFVLDDTENLDGNTPAYIYDSVTSEYHDLKEGIFEIDLPAGTYENRFTLRFNNAPLSIVHQDFKDSISIDFISSSNTLTITNKNGMAITGITLFNILGQNLNTWKIEDKPQISLPFTNFSTGTYIVKVHTSQGPISKKIIIK